MLPPIPIPAVIVGTNRETTLSYLRYAHERPEEFQIIGVAAPPSQDRSYLINAHQIPAKRIFDHWMQLFDQPHMADLVIVAGDMSEQVEIARVAIHAGYHVLLDAPLSLDATACIQLEKLAQETTQYIFMGYSLRFTAFYRALRDIIASDRLGKILNYRQDSEISLWAFAHQALRNPTWRTHDNALLWAIGLYEFDLLHWLVDENIERISSLGSYQQFDLKSAPNGDLPLRCIGNCPIEANCGYSAIGTYLERRFPDLPAQGSPYSALSPTGEQAALVQRVENDHWGHCVYHLNQELMNYQTVLMKTDSGSNLSLSINANGLINRRVIQIDGSAGSLKAEFAGLESHITFKENAGGRENTINFRIAPGNHGGEFGLVGHLTSVISGRSDPLNTLQDTLYGMLLAFAADEARLSEEVIRFPLFMSQFDR